LGFVPGDENLTAVEMAHGSNIDVLYLLGADEIPIHKSDGTFVIYQGSHGDAGAHAADVVLPGATYTEKSATYVNTEGRAQMTQRAIFPPGEAREDWKIIRALSAVLGETLPYDNIGALRKAMYAATPTLTAIDEVEPADPKALDGLGGSGQMTAEPFSPVVDDFYLTNPIARASAVMAELSQLRSGMREAAE
ncbi:MAG: molybdopterin-dependent oxidoreductase, partial [Methyloligellaceae bacterium]